MLSQPMMDSGGKAECWSRWSIEEALLVKDPPESPGNLCSQEMERALFWNPSCATYEPSIDGEERLSPSHLWLTRDFGGGTVLQGILNEWLTFADAQWAWPYYTPQQRSYNKCRFCASVEIFTEMITLLNTISLSHNISGGKFLIQVNFRQVFNKSAAVFNRWNYF